MKFRDAAKAYFKKTGMTDETLLVDMKELDHGKQTRFFDKIDLTEDDTAAQKFFSTILLKNKSDQTTYDIYKAIATGKESKVSSAFKAIEQQLTESSDWKEFWEGKNTVQELSLKQNLINAYRFAIIQNLYAAAMDINPQALKYVKAIEKLSNEYEHNRPTNTDDNSDDPIIKDLNTYIARKSKPSTLTLKRVKTLSRTLSTSNPAGITHMYEKEDGEKIKIAKELKALLLTKEDAEKTKKLLALEERYKKIQNEFGTSTLRDCLDAAKKRLPDDSAHLSI